MPKYKNKNTRLAVILTTLALLIGAISAAAGFYRKMLPDKYYTEGVSDRNDINIKTAFPVMAVMNPADPGLSADYGASQNSGVNGVAGAGNIGGEDFLLENKNTSTLKLFGIFPIKDVEVEEIERPALVPCGTPFGIKIMTSGVIVTEYGEVETSDGIAAPAKEEGIKIGDIITSVNGRAISTNEELAGAVQTDPEKTVLTVVRPDSSKISSKTASKSEPANSIANEPTIEIVAKPVHGKLDSILKIGIWVRDSSAGIGTMTYYDPDRRTFAGLGHGVCDIDTGQLLPLSKGGAVSVSISDVVKGTAGSPGELCGTFLSRVPPGVIKYNTDTGIFGSMTDAPTIGEPIPMAFKQEVHTGEASILSTLSGGEPKEYSIVIEKISFNEDNKIKNMIVRVTDAELLDKAGGIVQGMSGSPIIQDGRLAGAVTHVFVGDTTRGYAIFAENMYRSGVTVSAEEPEEQEAEVYQEEKEAA